MDLRQLRYFVTIIQCGSITRASVQLNVAQPALSLHVRNMEADLGTALLFRTPQGVLPTEAGAILLRHAQVVLAQVEQARAEIAGSQAAPSGEVRIGLPSSISPLLGVKLSLAARERFPAIRLRVAEAMSGFVLDWLRAGRVDLGLHYRPVDERGLHATKLLAEALVMFGPADAAADPAPMPLSALADRRLILPGPGHGLRDMLDDTAAAHGLRLSPEVEIDSYGAIKQMVEAGLGVSVLPAHAVGPEVAAGRLRAWPFAPPLMRTIHLVRPVDRPPSPAAQAVERLLRGTVAELVRSGGWEGAQLLVAAPA